MTGLISFLASPTGRLARVVAGAALIVVGLIAVGGTAGVIIAIIGLAPLAAGVLDFCIFAPLAGFPFSGAAIRNGSRR
jgi:hypothetical protein